MKFKIHNLIIFGVTFFIIIILSCRKESPTIEPKVKSDCVQHKQGATVITYDSLGWPHGTTLDSVKNCYEIQWRPDGLEWHTYYD